LGFCSVIAIGLAVTAMRNWRYIHLCNAIIMGTGVILTLSRGGILSYVGTLVLLGVLLAMSRSERTKRLVVVQAALAGSLLVAGYLAYTSIAHEL